MSNFFNAIYDSNLCSYYVLPLMRLNMNSFGSRNFINSYLSKDGSRLIVKLMELTGFQRYDDDTLENIIREPEHTLIVFLIHPKWRKDIEAFMEGRYTGFTEEARMMIIKYSGLLYRQENPVSKRLVTDSRLLAIDRDEIQRDFLRAKMELELGCAIPHGAELISKPREDTYMDIDISDMV